jgi:hypothetical protein
MTSPPPWLLPALGTGFLLLVSACTDEAPPPGNTVAEVPSSEITSEIRPNESKDLVFSIQKQDVAADGSRTLQVQGTHKGAEVGLIIVLGAKWESVAPDPKSTFAFHTGRVEYRSVGPSSNALLTALDEIYETKLQPKGMNPATEFSAASIDGDPDDLGKGEVKIKLTYVDKREDRMAEVYTNIDLPKRQLRICEKDPAFRAALIKALTRE